MTKNTTNEHAAQFMMSIEPDYGLYSIGEMVVQAVSEDKKAAIGFEKIKSWLASSLIDQPTSVAIDRTRNPLQTTDLIGGPRGTDTILAIAHARARHILRASPSSFTYKQILKRLKKADELLAGIEPELIGEILLRAEGRRRNDDNYNNRILEEIRSVKKLVGRGDRLFQALSETGIKFEDGEDGSSSRAASLAAARTRCSINGVPMSCPIVIIVIIIIVVVTKVHSM